MESLVLALLLSLCVSWGGVLATRKPSCPLGPESLGQHWVADSDNCSVFYLCYGGQRFEFNCGNNVWDPETKTCVSKGSQWDKCSVLKALDDMAAEVTSCEEGSTAVFAKADNCAQYYNCSSREATITDDPKLQECQFPLLFNAESKRCEHSQSVKCEQRQEPLDACDYAANHCSRSAHCVPCNVRFPSCRGLTDGLNPWIGREYSPFFVLCQSQRPLYHAAAASSARLENSAIHFIADENNCSAFHVWLMGQKIAASCPTGHVFDNHTATCVPALSSSDRCDYEVNLCDGHANCGSRKARFPSCRGLADGVNGWRGRQRSPEVARGRQRSPEVARGRLIMSSVASSGWPEPACARRSEPQ